MEYKYTDKLNLVYRSSVSEAGNKFTKGLRDIFLILIPAGIGYRTFFRDEYAYKKLYKKLEEKERKAKQRKEKNQSKVKKKRKTKQRKEKRKEKKKEKKIKKKQK